MTALRPGTALPRARPWPKVLADRYPGKLPNAHKASRLSSALAVGRGSGQHAHQTLDAHTSIRFVTKPNNKMGDTIEQDLSKVDLLGDESQMFHRGDQLVAGAPAATLDASGQPENANLATITSNMLSSKSTNPLGSIQNATSLSTATGGAFASIPAASGSTLKDLIKHMRKSGDSN